jgi:hypothetical protein
MGDREMKRTQSFTDGDIYGLTSVALWRFLSSPFRPDSPRGGRCRARI